MICLTCIGKKALPNFLCIAYQKPTTGIMPYGAGVNAIRYLNLQEFNFLP